MIEARAAENINKGQKIIIHNGIAYRQGSEIKEKHPAEITMEELDNLPWACCGAKVPAGESCPVCGDKE